MNDAVVLLTYLLSNIPYAASICIFIVLGVMIREFFIFKGDVKNRFDALEKEIELLSNRRHIIVEDDK